MTASRGGYSGSRPGSEMRPPEPIPSGYTVRSADWLDGHAAGYEAGWKAALAEAAPPRTCSRPGCSRLVLRDPESGLCNDHRGQP